eukprot:719409-Amphidinium_carterae.1
MCSAAETCPYILAFDAVEGIREVILQEGMARVTLGPSCNFKGKLRCPILLLNAVLVPAQGRRRCLTPLDQR